MSRTLTREMGLTHGDFFRILPKALAGKSFRVDGTVVTVDDGEACRVIIRLAPEAERRIARLCLPVTRVSFTFEGFAEPDSTAFMRRFERHFQRGGG